MRSIVCISGTSRPDNFTSRALAVACDELGKLSIDVQLFDARQLTLAFPGYPQTDDASRLVAAVGGAAGVVLATPEYHGSFSAMTKLIIENLGFPSVLKDKAVGLIGVAAGRIGAIKSLEQLRTVCAHTGAVVMPGAVSVAAVRNAFPQGKPVEPAVDESLRNFARAFVKFLDTYVCPRFVLEAMARTEGEPWTATV